jgi:hypothetical protein
VENKGIKYQCLAFVCPGCAEMHSNSGLHMLPVNTTEHSPSWDWDGNLEAPTLSPSILTGVGENPSRGVCHSYLKAGVFEYLGDCTHSMKNQHVPMGDLPEWFTE